MATTKKQSTQELLKEAMSTEGNVCHICDTPAHYRITLGNTGEWGCIEHVQNVIEALIMRVTGQPLVVDPASYYEREQRKKGGSK